MYLPGQDAHYLTAGLSAVANMESVLRGASIPEPRKILDLGCGHGRVMRVLRAAYPRASLTACDIDAAGVGFCSARFGARGVVSAGGFRDLEFPALFDLIWGGSILTHLKEPQWSEFLQFGEKWLSPEGVLVFTTLGRHAARSITAHGFAYGLGTDEARRVASRFAKGGFGYGEYPTHPGYGMAMASPAWVISKICASTGLQLIALSEMAWDNHQDVYACAYRERRVEQEIASYAEGVAAAIGNALSGAHEEERVSKAENALQDLVAARIARDHMPYGPRIVSMVQERVRAELQRRGRDGPTSGASSRK